MELKKFRADAYVVAAVEAAEKVWKLLREISGELTEFPEKLTSKVEADLSEKYEKKMSDVKQEYENKIATLEQDYLEKTRIRLKEKLVMLSQQLNSKVN
jgi:hypothetical protein